MPKLVVFSLYDSKVNAFQSPFVMRTRGEALRGFQEIVNDPNTTVSRHPEDFALMELGEYDESTGQFTNNPTPLNLGLAVQYKNKPQAVAPLFSEGKN